MGGSDHHISMERLLTLQVKLQVKCKNTCVFSTQPIAGTTTEIGALTVGKGPCDSEEEIICKTAHLLMCDSHNAKFSQGDFLP